MTQAQWHGDRLPLPKDPYLLAALAPAIFPIHVLEEYSAGFVSWFNSLAHPPITVPLFLVVNLVAFLVTLVMAAAAVTSQSRESLMFAIAWLGLLMAGNAVFHLVGTIAHLRYSPGTVTATLLYLPFFALFATAAHRQGQVRLRQIGALTCLGAAPMLTHGFLIIFMGSRLF